MERAIELEKKQRVGFEVCKKDGNFYELQNTALGKKLKLRLYFDDIERLPDCHDVLYFSDNVFQGMREHLYMYQFSKTVGNPCARGPHDFMAEPREFLILQYADGDTILLEQQYG